MGQEKPSNNSSKRPPAPGGGGSSPVNEKPQDRYTIGVDPGDPDGDFTDVFVVEEDDQPSEP